MLTRYWTDNGSINIKEKNIKNTAAYATWNLGLRGLERISLLGRARERAPSAPLTAKSAQRELLQFLRSIDVSKNIKNISFRIYETYHYPTSPAHPP